MNSSRKLSPHLFSPVESRDRSEYERRNARSRCRSIIEFSTVQIVDSRPREERIEEGERVVTAVDRSGNGVGYRR